MRAALLLLVNRCLGKMLARRQLLAFWLCVSSYVPPPLPSEKNAYSMGRFILFLCLSFTALELYSVRLLSIVKVDSPTSTFQCWFSSVPLLLRVFRKCIIHTRQVSYSCLYTVKKKKTPFALLAKCQTSVMSDALFLCW